MHVQLLQYQNITKTVTILITILMKLSTPREIFNETVRCLIFVSDVFQGKCRRSYQKGYKNWRKLGGDKPKTWPGMGFLRFVLSSCWYHRDRTTKINKVQSLCLTYTLKVLFVFLQQPFLLFWKHQRRVKRLKLHWL